MKDSHYSFIYEEELNHWWYRVRRKIVKDLLNVYVPSQIGDFKIKVLDIGCGCGAMIKELSELYDCYGIDISEAAVGYSRQRLIENIILGDVTKIPFKNESFDVVLAMDILEHVEQDQGAIREIKRVLRVGGCAIIFVPTFRFLWSVTDVISMHKRRYTLGNLSRKISESGLNIIRKTYFNSFLFLPICLIRIIVKLLRLPMRSENNVGGKFMNRILYIIFYFESILLKHINFPFGVSAMIVCRK